MMAMMAGLFDSEIVTVLRFETCLLKDERPAVMAMMADLLDYEIAKVCRCETCRLRKVGLSVFEIARVFRFELGETPSVGDQTGFCILFQVGFLPLTPAAGELDEHQGSK